MNRVVIDPSALLTWFGGGGGAHGSLRAEYESGSLTILAPRHLVADVLGELAGRPGHTAEGLGRIGAELERLGFQLEDPPAGELAAWLANGLDARPAAYAALAATLDVPLVAGDPDLRRVAADLLLRS